MHGTLGVGFMATWALVAAVAGIGISVDQYLQGNKVIAALVVSVAAVICAFFIRAERRHWRHLQRVFDGLDAPSSKPEA